MATRLQRAADHDAVVVAAVALERLGLADRISEVLSPRLMVPQVAQGALAVECRSGDTDLRAALAAIEHGPSRTAVDAERAFLEELGGDCTLPAGAHATWTDDATLVVRGVLGGAPDGAGRVTVHDASAEGTDPQALGRSVAATLRDAVGHP
jgi:hydroxymethylbilane synthase